MIGDYVYNSVVLRAVETSKGLGWSARIRIQDAGFCDDDAATRSISTEADFYTRYSVYDTETTIGAITAAEVLMEDIERLGVKRLTSLRLVIIVDQSKSDFPISSIPKDARKALEDWCQDNNYDLYWESGR